MYEIMYYKNIFAYFLLNRGSKSFKKWAFFHLMVQKWQKPAPLFSIFNIKIVYFAQQNIVYFAKQNIYILCEAKYIAKALRNPLFKKNIKAQVISSGALK